MFGVHTRHERRSQSPSLPNTSGTTFYEDGSRPISNEATRGHRGPLLECVVGQRCLVKQKAKDMAARCFRCSAATILSKTRLSRLQNPFLEFFFVSMISFCFVYTPLYVDLRRPNIIEACLVFLHHFLLVLVLFPDVFYLSLYYWRRLRIGSSHFTLGPPATTLLLGKWVYEFSFKV